MKENKTIAQFLGIIKQLKMKENKTIAQFLGITKFPFEIKDEQGKIIYFEESTRYWDKSEYDPKGNKTRFENSRGFWWKQEYDANGKETLFENSRGYCSTRQYDVNGREIYYEDSLGNIRDNRPKQVEFTLAEIATKLNIPVELLRIKE